MERYTLPLDLEGCVPEDLTMTFGSEAFWYDGGASEPSDRLARARAQRQPGRRKTRQGGIGGHGRHEADDDVAQWTNRLG